MSSLVVPMEDLVTLLALVLEPVAVLVEDSTSQLVS